MPRGKKAPGVSLGPNVRLTMEFLLGSDAFWTALKVDLESAQHRILMQMMTFEGDSVGTKVIDAVRVSNAADKRILVDSYTRYVQSDRFLYSPSGLLSGELRAEAEATRRMFAALQEEGGQVRYTNPVGPLFIRMVARNHKKLIVIDDRVAYIGGFNFSEHNFGWHDLMVRIEDEALATFLATDFEDTWEGRSTAKVGRFEGCDIHLLDAINNESAFGPIIDVLTSAERSLHVVSPYLTFPFTTALAALPKRGVEVTLITPRDNNKGIVRDYLMWEAHRYGFTVQLVDAMSHMKAALVDDRYLLVGSSNFDFLSYRIEEEVIAVISDAALIAAFKTQVLEPDLARSQPYTGQPNALKGKAAYAALKAVDRLAVLARRPGG